MSCLTPEQIDRYARGTLDAPLTAEVEAHLQQCAACRRKVEQARVGEQLLGKIKDLPESTQPSSVAREAGSSAQTVPADAEESALPLFSSPPPDSFTGYQIIREIHRGGQGVVYQAFQKSTKRKVALKVLKEGPFASPAERARFEREVTILGQLSHPNIVTVHDSGVAAGYFYFVMDYISGQPLDVWIASGEHSVEETLRLFAKICEAVNAAHLHGIIHRDLKPGNIRIDPEGQPHVLDFGLAKMGVGQMGNGSQPLMMTVTGQFMGSLPWASPEQAEAAPGKVDIRTDVYSLGVILYQMLTGKFPYDVIGNMRDVLDRILKAEPAKPSTIRKQINDEVETIVLKCLSKERERRYQSAGELARDITHYLAGEPIEAKRDSALYVLRKQLRKYKVPAGIAACFVLLITVGLGVSLTLWRQAVTAERQKTVERERANSKAAEAEAARQTEVKAREAVEYNSYVANVEMAAAAMDFRQFDRVRERLDACPERLRGWEWRWLNADADGSLVVLRGHTQPVTYAAFSSDGTRIVTASGDDTSRVWDTTTGVSLAELKGHTETVTYAAFSPDGTRVLTASYDGTARVWDAATGAAVVQLKAGSRTPWIAAFSRDGTRIATESNDHDHALQVWDAVTGASIAVVGLDIGQLGSASFSPDGTRIVATSLSGLVLVLDAATGKRVAEFGRHKRGVSFAKFGPDGTRLLTVSGEGIARVWDAVTGTSVAELKRQMDEQTSFAFSPDGARIVAACNDTAQVWDAATGGSLAEFKGHVGKVTSASFSPDGTRIVAPSLNASTCIWDAGTGERIAELRGHTYWVSSASFSPDGTRIVTASADQTARIWDAAIEAGTVELRGNIDFEYFPSSQGETRSEWIHLSRTARVLVSAAEGSRPGQDFEGEATSAVFSADGKLITAVYGDGSALVWDVATGMKVSELLGHEDIVRAASFSPDGMLMVTTSGGETARVFNTRTWASVAELRGHTARVRSASFSTDGMRIVTASDDRSARVWLAATGVSVAELEDHTGGVTSAAFSPDGTRIVTASDDHIARVWDVATGASLAELQGHKAKVTSASFSRDGMRIVTASWDGTARLWDAATGASVAVLKGHKGVVYSATFSPDGTRIATASGDRTARVWDAATGASVAELKGHKVEVTSASFSPDGTRIVTASMDGIARVWDSVLYRERFAEIEAVRKAEPAMGELVTRRLTAGESPAVLAESLAKDRAFTEPQRAAALAALHRRCTDEAKARREASSLNGQAWPVLVEPNSPAEAVARALDQAARAAVLAPDDGYIVNTLGVARYRVGDYEHALATLRRSDELNSRSDAPHNQGSNQETPPSSQPSYTAARDTGLPTDAAFITMSLHQLCRADEARAALERLRRLMEQDRWTNDKESQAFLREAEALIEGTPTSAPASAPDTDAPSSSSAESTEPPDE